MKRVLSTIAIILAASMLSFSNSPKNAAQLFNGASKEFDANRFESALNLYLKADSAFVAEGLANTEEYAQALHNTGRALLNTDQIEKGREYTLKAMQLREKLVGKNNQNYINSLNNYALTFLINNELQDALKYQSEVIDLCRKMNPPHPNEGMYLINLGRIQHNLGEDAEAVKSMEEALGKVEKFSDNYEYILTFLGNYYMDVDDNANTNRILGLMDEHNRHELTKECNDLECHIQRAQYYAMTGDQARAKDEYMIVFAMPLTDTEKAYAHEKYAGFLFDQRDFVQAADYYAMAADIMKKAAGISEKSVDLVRRAGLCYFVGKDYDKSVEAHSQVIKAVDANGYSEKMKSSSLEGLGNAYKAKKDYPNAISSFKLWISHLKNNGHEGEADFAKAYERLASSEKFNSNYDESIADYETAIALYEKLGMHDEAQAAKDGLKLCRYYARMEMGDSEENDLARQQRDDKTRETLRSSLNVLEQSGDYLGKLSEAQSLATIAGCYAQLEDYSNAVDYYSRYLNALRPALAEDFLLKSPRERELTWKHELGNITEMSAMIVDLPQGTEDHQDLYMRLSNLIYEGQLLSKGILLSSNIEFDKVLNRYGTPDMKSTYQEIKNNLLEIEKMRQERQPTDKILDLSRKTEALQLALARDAASKGIYTDFLRYTSADVANALRDDEAAVEFAVLDTGLFPDQDLIVGVAITKEIPTGIALPIATVSDISTVIADADKFSKDEYGIGIWGAIMQVAAGKKKIYFAPDGVLNNIGIEYLQFNGKPISEIIGMSRLSSTRELCRKHPAMNLQYAALFGDIDYYENGLPASDKRAVAYRGADVGAFQPLDNTSREIAEISSLLKQGVADSKVFPFTGVKASKGEFLSQDQIPLNLLHIATHGKYVDEGKGNDSDAMDRSILAFAGANLHDGFNGNDGIVTASEIADMSFQDCDLAVLSACESGLGKLGNDGVFGLQRGFKNAGVQSLLVSLNEVADEATADMMIEFYRNLMTPGTSKRDALQKAQSAIRSKYPSDPTWASFILIDSFN